MHRLLKKKALDAVNEALLSPSDYPGANDDGFNPGYFKGTEPEQIKHAFQSPMQQQREKNLSSWQKDHPDFKRCPKCKGDGVQVSRRKRDYSQCSQCTGTGWKYAPAKQGRFKGYSRIAQVDLHEAPDKLPPRTELRTRLDQDVKDEMDDEKPEYHHISRLLEPRN